MLKQDFEIDCEGVNWIEMIYDRVGVSWFHSKRILLKHYAPGELWHNSLHQIVIIFCRVTENSLP
jgi:hypothetical protein